MNPLSTKFNTKSLLLFALPTMLMMTFMSAYTIVDGLFVANLVGEDALAAINIAFPVINLVLALGLMFATGGTAVMGRLMGEGRADEARSFLSVVYLIALGLGFLISVFFVRFPHEIVTFLRADAELYDYAIDYLLALAPFATTFFLQVFVQSFFVLAGKPMLGFSTCFAGGITNIILDYFFISPDFLNLGITGAGWATGIGNAVPAVFGLVYFACNRRGTLYFGAPVLRLGELGQSMFNGMSELVTQLSTAVTTLLFNITLLDLVDKSGVTSITVILYIQMLQMAVYLGYSIGVAPVISYNYGAQNHEQLRRVVEISLKFIGVASLAVIALSLLCADVAVAIFISVDSPTFEMAKRGLQLFSIAYLFMGFNIFLSSMFTALSNGRVSAILSLARTLVFLVGSILILPSLFRLDGVWLAVPVAELLASLLSLHFYRTKRRGYGY